MRLDKFISTTTTLSRAEAKKVIKKGILINDKLIKTPDYKIDEFKDQVIVNGNRLVYQKYVYIMMNKPKDTVSATEDVIERTVVDILRDEDRIYKVFPVGRLDKDTEGLMLLTNDGELAHKLISPKKDVEKKYYVEVSGELKNEHLKIIKEGVILEDGYRCKPARLEILDSSEGNSKANIFITEGKFHQVKRMMKSLGATVTYLKRLSIGSLKLDENLKLGEYRYLTDDELNKLTK
ncbi:MAG: rRNA pseudouridine synthase [Gemella haemolysans]|uniref:pseudouridine synthase n=1 Tax=Gemella haemolysans TaxID=1379 RepID=UPI001207C278|nr:pseudouridine synthase [Gemella haemolysans]MBS5318443.1 rRNA pseudouridine synthase [Gemella haemolysans]MDU6766644.1 pseudouridine synthase [Gemella haemolysans]TKW63660.1 MAG: rRNA pseudouridine synthase [Gemella sp.]